MKKILLICILFLTGCTNIVEVEVSVAPNLAASYKDYFDIGVAVTSSNVNSLVEQNLINEFNTFTAEYEMKWDKIQPSISEFDFTFSDKIVDFADEHNKTIRGHTLIWRTDVPNFIKEIGNSNESNSVKINKVLDLVTVFYTNMYNRYGATLNVWDVANEVIEDSNDYLYRHDNIYFEMLGYNESDFEYFIAEVFKMVERVSPEVTRYYNDYFLLTDPIKRNKVITFINNIRRLGAKVDGIGMQSHITTSITKSQVDEALKDFREHNLKVSFTELDISIYEKDFIAPTQPFSNLVLSDYDDKLSRAFNHVFSAARENKDIVENITFWGIYDKDSWLVKDFYNYRTDFPLLFDDNYNKKKCYYIVKDFEVYKGGL